MTSTSSKSQMTPEKPKESQDWLVNIIAWFFIIALLSQLAHCAVEPWIK